MRALMVFALIVISGFCLDSYKIGAAEMQYTANFFVQGDSGTITVLEYPITTARQTVSCSSDQLKFPPYELNMVCNVSTNPIQSFSFESYEQISFTDSSAEMIELAQSLSANSSFQTAINIASWIRNNLEYDSAYGELVRTASQTFDTRKGTCDEWTHLFLALIKSVGYEARYVAGYALGSAGWEPHAWAEVWTRYGWQGFDLTFGQYGYVDGTHIAFAKTAGGTKSYYNVSYLGSLDIEDDIHVEILDYTEIELVGELRVGNLTGNQTTVMTLDVNNLFDWKIGFEALYGLPNNLDISLLDAPQIIVLEPGNNTIKWILRTPEIEQGHSYVVPISVGLGNFQFSTSFGLSPEARSLSLPSQSWLSQLLEKLISLFDRFFV
ncbi:MAG: transglutaminase domain-containing protein [Candidatus Altiarchaeota archaeon]|nr:transglutaminase domain-containing protein [Candidatus Altiarchaeota archaeon]